MKRQIIEGTIQGNERGYAFLIPTDGQLEDFFIPHSDLKGAMHKDLVLAEATYGNGERTTARVLKIIERGCSLIVGTYYSSRSGGFVVSDDKKYSSDVFVPFGRGLKAKTGDKVVCKITSYQNRKNPEGLIKEVLGRQFSREAELKSIQKAYNLQDVFPNKVIKSANLINQPDENDFVGRKDFTNLCTFTIDGEDSRDFDDAVSIKKIKNNYELGVHIADVSHYVKQGGEIDLEALNRGTSVYFPESVIPMLPEKLCNDVCSLKQGVNRLTISCIILLDSNGNVIESKIYKSFINSTARTTYSQVQGVIDGDENCLKELSSIVKDIRIMEQLADVLIKKREDKGCVDLDVKESAIFVDKNGEISVTSTPRDKAHRIIEEFMILANVCVAKTMFEAGVPCIYRVHESPVEEKYRQLLVFLDSVGVKAKFVDNLTTKDYQDILLKSQNNPAFNVINRVMLRSMQKAKYSQSLKEHFGLGEECYCHFTSPIRRYPDLFVHRVLKEYLEKGKTFVFKKYDSIAQSVASKSSETERNALEVERAVDDYYKTLYISDYVGEEFDGIISGVMPFGVFVELENGIEGLVKVENIRGKNFNCDVKNFTLSNGKINYRLGQKVKIKVAGVNITDRRADFLFVN